MRTLVGTSVVSVLCAAAVWLFVVQQLVSSGVVELDDVAVLIVVVLAPAGLIVALVGAVAGTIGTVRGRGRTWVGMLMTLGQVLTVALAVGIIVWSQKFGTTGWELLMLPVSLMLGQVPVAAGLIVDRIGRRRRARLEP